MKYTSKRTYVTHKLFDKDYPAIHEINPVLILNKPIYAGFTVSELSKRMMYDFHYNFIKKSFNAKLLFTDTDTFNFLNGKICLTLVMIQKILSFMMMLIKKFLVK